MEGSREGVSGASGNELDPAGVAGVVKLTERLGGGGGAERLLQLTAAAAVPHCRPRHDDDQLGHKEHGAGQHKAHHVDANP